MEKTEEKLNLDIEFNVIVLALNLFIFMFLISAGPILMNSQIEFIKSLFPELPGMSINYPTVPEMSQSLSEPIIVLSSGGIFITIVLLLIFIVHMKLNPNKIYSFTDPKRKHFLFYSYVLIAGFLLFIGFANAISIGINTLVLLSILISIGIFYIDAFIADITPDKEGYNKRKVNDVLQEEEEQSNDQKTKVKINLKWRRDKKGRPYAICPKCHSKIYYLEAEKFIGAIFRHHIVAPNEDGELSCYEWFNEDNTPGKEDIFGDCSYLDYFKCPKCLQTIADNSEEAKALFQKKVAKNK